MVRHESNGTLLLSSTNWVIVVNYHAKKNQCVATALKAVVLVTVEENINLSYLRRSQQCIGIAPTKGNY